MICISLANISYHDCLEYLNMHDCFELRLDKLSFTNVELKSILSHNNTFIATQKFDSENIIPKKKQLKIAINNKVKYIDIDYATEAELRDELVAYAKSKNCKVILSYHDYLQTPNQQILQYIIDDCFTFGADIAKVACMANTKDDCDTLVGLNISNPDKKIIAIGMGALGRSTRIAGILVEEHFNYCSPEIGKETADGQFDFRTMMEYAELAE